MAAKRDDRHRIGQSGFAAVAGLFVPRTKGFRRIFLVVVLISISLPIPYPFRWIVLGPALILFLFTPAFVTGLAILATAVSLAMAFLAASGNISYIIHSGQNISLSPTSAGVVGWAEIVVVLAILWLLLGVPTQAHRAKVKKDGAARDFLVGVITAASSLLTATYLLLLHFAGGPLQPVSRGPLVAGIVFAAVLLVPIYSWLARACWQQGFGGVIGWKSLKERWRQVVAEVQEAPRTRGGADKSLGRLDRALLALYTYERRSPAPKSPAADIASAHERELAARTE
jgi:hypothetical protein